MHLYALYYAIKKHLIALQWKIVGFENYERLQGKKLLCVFLLETYYMDLHIFFWKFIDFSFSISGSPFNFVFKLELFWKKILIFFFQCLLHSWKYQIFHFFFFFIGLLHFFTKIVNQIEWEKPKKCTSYKSL
jgi:hypothetical protein